VRIYQSRIILVLGIAALLVIGSMSFGIVALLDFRSSVKKIADLEEAIGSLEVIFSEVKDIESARRGFLLTQDEAYLQPYYKAETSLFRLFGVMERLSDDKVISKVSWLEIANLVIARVNLAKDSIELFKTNMENSPHQRDIGKLGKEAMETLRGKLAEVMGEARARKMELKSASVANESLVIAVMILCAATVACLIAVSLATLWVQTRRRIAAELETRNALGDSEHANADLRNKNALFAELTETSHLLQTCREFGEAKMVLQERAPRSFPESVGALYLMRDAHGLLENVCSWGMEAEKNDISVDDCWGLRKGKAHIQGEKHSAPACAHAADVGHGQMICIPMQSHGEACGLLVVQYDQEIVLSDDHMGYLAGCAEQFIIALSNLQLRERLRLQAVRDPLSGLFNRRYMLETAERELSRALRQGESPISLLMIDIDYFKKFNDEFGHDAGDHVIKVISDLLQRAMRGSDVASRYGGEEFLLLLPGATKSNALAKAEALCESARAIPLIRDRVNLGRVTLSIGVAAYPSDGHTIDMLITAADHALYQAKHAGRDRALSAGGSDVNLQAIGKDSA